MATVALKGTGLIDEVKKRADVRLIQVTAANRDGLPSELADWLINWKRGLQQEPHRHPPARLADDSGSA
jgi:hypothetical protein